jgi:hypothetical protein
MLARDNQPILKLLSKGERLERGQAQGLGPGMAAGPFLAVVAGGQGEAVAGQLDQHPDI